MRREVYATVTARRRAALTFSSLRSVRVLKLEVALDRPANSVPLRIGRFPDDACGDAKDERVGWNAHSLRADGTGADNRARPHVNAVQDHGSHRDQYVVFDRRAVNDCAV